MRLRDDLDQHDVQYLDEQLHEHVDEHLDLDVLEYVEHELVHDLDLVDDEQHDVDLDDLDQHFDEHVHEHDAAGCAGVFPVCVGSCPIGTTCTANAPLGMCVCQ